MIDLKTRISFLEAMLNDIDYHLKSGLCGLAYSVAHDYWSPFGRDCYIWFKHYLVSENKNFEVLYFGVASDSYPLDKIHDNQLHRYFHWFPGEVAPRADWLKEKINQLKQEI